VLEEDPFNLQRFVEAQATTFEAAIAELRAGRKRSHWMWFMFPQLRGLGRSRTAEYYGIGSADEARAYLAHGHLGTRLEHATRAVSTTGLSAHTIFGTPDDLKFRSSMTLFAFVSPAPGNLFRAALERWFGGRMDDATLKLLDASRRT
jgi:uncharacterized protein (DUF1810 family)